MAKRKRKAPKQPPDLPPGVRLVRVLKEPDLVFDLAWSPDGRYLVSASMDDSVGVWEWETGKERRALKGHSNSVLGVVVAPDSSSVVSGSTDRTIKVWDMQSGRTSRTLEARTEVAGIALAPQEGSRVSPHGCDVR